MLVPTLKMLDLTVGNEILHEFSFVIKGLLISIAVFYFGRIVLQSLNSSPISRSVNVSAKDKRYW